MDELLIVILWLCLVVSAINLWLLIKLTRPREYKIRWEIEANTVESDLINDGDNSDLLETQFVNSLGVSTKNPLGIEYDGSNGGVTGCLGSIGVEGVTKAAAITLEMPLPICERGCKEKSECKAEEKLCPFQWKRDESHEPPILSNGAGRLTRFFLEDKYA